MDNRQQNRYPQDGVARPPQEWPLGTQPGARLSRGAPVQSSSTQDPYTSPLPGHVYSHEDSQDGLVAKQYQPVGPDNPYVQEGRRLSKKWQRRLYWIVPLGILVIVLVILFEVYKADFERWVSPLANWLRDSKSWSWVIPVVILIVLSFPPLFGHEIVLIIVGLTYPLGVALGIACAGAVLGEAACFIVFKYAFTWWVEKKIAEKVSWAATARVSQQAGFRGVLLIRYSVVPPHLANPLFSCTGMEFWLYMVTVILSLPKTLVFVALGTPSSGNSKGAKVGKVIAIGVVVVVTIIASFYIYKKMSVAVNEIEQERAISQGDEELGMMNSQIDATGLDDTSYQGAATPMPDPYKGTSTTPSYQQF